MIIEEFINTYAEQELAKINKIQQNEKEKEELEDDVDSLDIPPASRSKLLSHLTTLQNVVAVADPLIRVQIENP